MATAIMEEAITPLANTTNFFAWATTTTTTTTMLTPLDGYGNHGRGSYPSCPHDDFICFGNTNNRDYDISSTAS